MQRHQAEQGVDLAKRGGDMALERTAHWGVIDSSEPGGAMGPAPRLSVPKRTKAPAPRPDEMTTLLADAMGVAIADAQAKGRSLDEVLAEVLADDRLLEMHQRRLLGEAIVQIWNGGAIAAPNRD
ncbi:MAG: hypothetical protein Fur0042_03780 [Cyanophyceae cyanobacterium]